MAGIKGMHSRMSTSPDYANRVRARIKAAGITKFLEEHIAGKREMSTTQVTAALGLLRKVVPDISSVEHSGELLHRYVAEVPAVAPDASEWSQQHAPQSLQ